MRRNRGAGVVGCLLLVLSLCAFVSGVAILVGAAAELWR
jgi:hypothetical protein